MKMWVIRTTSGSLYQVRQDASGQWWLGGEWGRNVPNPNSQLLPHRLYRIEPPKPWPPQVGESLFLEALRILDRTDPERVPGGGKYTTPAVEVMERDDV